MKSGPSPHVSNLTDEFDQSISECIELLSRNEVQFSKLLVLERYRAINSGAEYDLKG